jgi:hypothetical protein
MNKKALIFLSLGAGILFILLAVIYFVTPAKSLPIFIPGFEPGVTKVHFKHGIGSLLLGVACFIFVWFKSGKKSSQ